MADTFARMKQLVGTTAEWAANNIVLGEGEIGVERIGVSDARAKCGDGVKTWSQLPYLSGTNAAVDDKVAEAAAHAATATTQAGIATTQAASASSSAAAASARLAFWQGAKTSDPATRNDTTALQTGDQYFNTTNDRMRVYEVGTGWIDYEATAQAAATTATTQAGIATTQAASATASAATAASEASTATSARIAAEAARDSSFASANVYSSVAAGLAAVSVGGQFQVADDSEFVRYRVDAGPVAVEVARYPSASAVSSVRADLDNVRVPISYYTGSNQAHPIITDSDGKLIMSVDRTTGRVAASGLADQEGLSEAGLMFYEGSGPIYPLITDSNNKVLLGIDANTGEAVGVLKSASSSTPLAETPLSTPIVKKAYNHILFYGQSLSVGAAGGSVISTSQPYSNVTFNGGPRAWNGTTWDFGTFKPLVEDSTSPSPDGFTNRSETACSGAANFASTLMAQKGVAPSGHVILASTAGRGGYSISQLNKGSAWYSNLLAHVSGAKAQSSDYAVHAICWLQGEQDLLNGTSYSTYRSALATLRSDIDTDIKAITGQTSPVYFITYQVSYKSKDSKAMALAQLDLAQTNSAFFLSAPTYRFPNSDDAHMTSLGYKLIGGYFGRAYEAISRGVQPQWLNPKAATIRGAQVRVRFDVPKLPLVLDQTSLPVTVDNGFKVLDGATGVAINSMVTDGNEVVLNLASTPTGTVTVRYALDYTGAGVTILNAGTGNLRDSTTDSMVISGTTYQLWHAAPAFELTAIKIGE